MQITPACEIRPVSECEPGTLIQLVGHHRVPREWALVCGVVDQPETMGIVNLGDVPSYSLIREPDKTRVLAMSDRPRLSVDMTGPSEPPFVELYEAPGAIIRNLDGWFLNLAPDQGPRYARGTLDLQTMSLVKDTERLNNTAIFGRWTILLGPSARRKKSRPGSTHSPGNHAGTRNDQAIFFIFSQR